MTALTPGCDPDMSVSGAPFGAPSGRGRRVRSWPALAAGVVLAVVAVVADAPGAVVVPLVAVGGLCAWALLGRALAPARRAMGAATPAAPARQVPAAVVTRQP
jgi:hypothetical protein